MSLLWAPVMLMLPVAKHPALYLHLSLCGNFNFARILVGEMTPKLVSKFSLFPFQLGKMTFSFFNSKNCFILGRVGGLFVLENFYRHMESYSTERKEISVSPKTQRSHKTQSLFRGTLTAGERPVLQNIFWICVRLDYERHSVVSSKSPLTPDEHLVEWDSHE